MTLKLCDFSISRFFSSDATLATMTVAGTLDYMAPELREAVIRRQHGAHYGSNVDIYSCGLLAFRLYKHKLPGMGFDKNK